MYCPACGSAAKDEQKICRSCGMNLQPIVPHVTEHAQATVPTRNVRKGLQKIEYCGIAIGASGAALMIATGIFALLALAFVGPEAKSMSPIWSKIFGIGLLLLLKGALLFAVPWIIKEFFPHKTAQAAPAETAKTKELLPASHSEPIEHTTRNLERVSQEEHAKLPASSKLTPHA